MHDYVQGPMILELQRLTHQRNQSGHSVGALALQQAEQLRKLVLGTSEREGLLQRLINLG